MKKAGHPTKMAHAFFGMALIAAVLAAVVALSDIDAILSLAGTQWLLVSIALGVLAANMHMCKDCMGKCCGEGTCKDKME